jgi:hypothetical protein
MDKPMKKRTTLLHKTIAKADLRRVRGGDESPRPVRQQLLATMILMG